jgi:hypothetical protein
MIIFRNIASGEQKIGKRFECDIHKNRKEWLAKIKKDFAAHIQNLGIGNVDEAGQESGSQFLEDLID